MVRTCKGNYETLFENVPNIFSHSTLVANKIILPKKFRIEKCHFYVWLSLERSDSYDLKWENISSLAKRWWIRSEFIRKHFDDSSKLLIRIHIETKLIFTAKWKKTYANTPISVYFLPFHIDNVEVRWFLLAQQVWNYVNWIFQRKWFFWSTASWQTNNKYHRFAISHSCHGPSVLIRKAGLLTGKTRKTA